MDSLDKLKLIEALMDKYLDIGLQISSEFWKTVGKYCDVAYCVGEDFGIQDRHWYSIDFYKKYIKKRHIKIIETVKKYTSAKIMFHCCGSVSAFFPDLIYSGVDIVSPVQTSAKDMEPKK